MQRYYHGTVIAQRDTRHVLHTMPPGSTGPESHINEESTCCGWKLCLSLKLASYLSIYLSIFEPFYLSIFLSIYLSIYRSIYLSVYLSIYLAIFLPFYLSIHLSIYIPIFLSFYLSIYLSFYRSIFLSIYLSTYLSNLSTTCQIYLQIAFQGSKVGGMWAFLVIFLLIQRIKQNDYRFVWPETFKYLISTIPWTWIYTMSSYFIIFSHNLSKFWGCSASHFCLCTQDYPTL